jgi:nitrite reductase (NADH) large subunit
MTYLIIGNGIAGTCAVEAIRELDGTSPIVMVSDEDTVPYSRPMISQVLDGSQEVERLPIRTPDFYERLKITPLLGQRVTRLDVAKREAILEDGTAQAFDRLLVSSGADARPLRVEGVDLDNIFYMRTRDDITRQLAALPDARQALVLGGGLVGFKAAYGLLRRGIPVTMLITSGYPLSQQVDPVAGKMILEELRERGLKVRVGVSVTAFEGEGRVAAAVTDRDERIPCDLVVIGKGVLPSLGFIPGNRIQIDLGILVDDQQQTSEPGIFAAGDAAECRDIVRKRPWVNAIWPEAASQGRVAGLNMAGRPVRYPGSLGRNVMRVYGLDVMTLGLADPDPADDCRVFRCGGTDKGYYRSLVFRQNTLVGAILVNRVEQGGVLHALIENRVRIRVPARTLMAPTFDFSRLLP